MNSGFTSRPIMVRLCEDLEPEGFGEPAYHCSLELTDSK